MILVGDKAQEVEQSGFSVAPKSPHVAMVFVTVAAMAGLGAWFGLNGLVWPDAGDRNWTEGMLCILCLAGAFNFLGGWCATSFAYGRAGFALKVADAGLTHFAAGYMSWKDLRSVEIESRMVRETRIYLYFIKSRSEHRSQYLRIAMAPQAYRSLKARLNMLDRFWLLGAISFDDKQSMLIIPCSVLDCRPRQLLKRIKHMAGTQHGCAHIRFAETAHIRNDQIRL